MSPIAISAEWCAKMAALEDGQEISAGIKHPDLLAAEFDANVDRLKACEHIADGDEGWEVLRNECPSTAAVARLRDTADARDTEIARLRAALEWYGENARLCRLIHSGGDAGRHALSEDGGKRARAALHPSSERTKSEP